MYFLANEDTYETLVRRPKTRFSCSYLPDELSRFKYNRILDACNDRSKEELTRFNSCCHLNESNVCFRLSQLPNESSHYSCSQLAGNRYSLQVLLALFNPLLINCYRKIKFVFEVILFAVLCAYVFVRAFFCVCICYNEVNININEIKFAGRNNWL